MSKQSPEMIAAPISPVKDSKHKRSTRTACMPSDQGISQVRISFEQVDLQVFLILLNSHRKTLPKSKKRLLQSALAEYEHLSNDIACLVAKTAREPAPRLLEVLACSMHSGRVAVDSVATNWLLLGLAGRILVIVITQEGQELLDRQIERHRPDLITWVPPCESSSIFCASRNQTKTIDTYSTAVETQDNSCPLEMS